MMPQRSKDRSLWQLLQRNSFGVGAAAGCDLLKAEPAIQGNDIPCHVGPSGTRPPRHWPWRSFYRCHGCRRSSGQCGLAGKNRDAWRTLRAEVFTPWSSAARSGATIFAWNGKPFGPVGASLLAMVVNDNAYLLAKRGALEPIVGTPPGASSLLQG